MGDGPQTRHEPLPERPEVRTAPSQASILTRALGWVKSRDEFVRVAIVAAMGTVLSWATYEIVYWLNPIDPHATSSWAIAFVIGIFRQHHMHRTISFPRNALSYGQSLRRDFVASIGIAVLSTGLNYLLTEVFEVYHRGAWVACVVFVAGFEYLMMKVFVFPRRRGGTWPSGRDDGPC